MQEGPQMIEQSNTKWPFLPTCLNDILDMDTLSVIESGSCERLGRPLTILDFDAKSRSFTHRIESVNEKQRYEEFCRYFRENDHVLGGDARCKRWDIGQANESLQTFQKKGQSFRVFHCHAGLIDMTHIIQIRGRPVALLFSGQFRPEDDDQIHNYLQRLVDEPNEDISTGQAEAEHLKGLTKSLIPIPADARAQLEKEAMHIQRIAEAAFERRKWQNEQIFLEELRSVANMSRSMDLEQLRGKVDTTLRMIKEYCNC